MKKRLLCAAACLLLLCLPLFGGAEAFDFSAYALEGPYLVDALPLDAENLTAQCWGDPEGPAEGGRFLAWWRGGQIYRQIEYAWTDDRHEIVPINGDTCRVLTFAADGGHVKMPEGYYAENTTRVTLHDWTADGLANPRALAEGVVDFRIARDGVALLRYQEDETYVTLYDGAGRQEADIAVDARFNALVRAARDGDGLWVVTLDVRQEKNAYHPMVIRDGRVIWQADTGALIHGAQMDGQGGYFVVEKLSAKPYAPVTITHYDGQANRLKRWELGGKNVVISAAPRVDPATGHLLVMGTASANSRGYRCAYLLEADEKGRVLRLDTRACPAGEDVHVSPYLSLDCRDARVLIQYFDGTPAAWVPFDALPAGEDPGLTLK